MGFASFTFPKVEFFSFHMVSKKFADRDVVFFYLIYTYIYTIFSATINYIVHTIIGCRHLYLTQVVFVINSNIFKVSLWTKIIIYVLITKTEQVLLVS